MANTHKLHMPSVGTRIGSGLGEYLAQSIPKEVERTRLSQGLKNLAKEENLSPFQRFTRLSTIPGVTPQMIETGGKLLTQQERNKSFGQPLEKTNAIPAEAYAPKGGDKESSLLPPSLTTSGDLSKAYEGYIRPDLDTMNQEAYRRFHQNPQRYANDFSNAQNEVAQLVESQAIQAKDYQTRHETRAAIQDNVVNRLQAHAGKLNVDIPANVYSEIEDKAIKSVLPLSEDNPDGGLTEQQAVKKFGKELDDISRDYSDLSTLDNWSIVGQKSKNSLDTLKRLQKSFKERKDTRNMADKLIGTSGLSPMLAYGIAQPVSDVPELSKELNSVPPLTVFENVPYFKQMPQDEIESATYKVSEKLAPYLKSDGSPLAVAYELKKKNYDPQTFLNYVSEHSKELDLRPSQIDQLNKSQSWVPTLSDWWLESFTGINEDKGRK